MPLPSHSVDICPTDAGVTMSRNKEKPLLLFLQSSYNPPKSPTYYSLFAF